MPEVYRNLIAGEWVECTSKKTFSNVNPANTDEALRETELDIEEG